MSIACRKSFVLCTIAWLGCAASGVRAAEASGFRLEDLRKLVSLSDARISPDGSRIALIVSAPDWKADKRRQRISRTTSCAPPTCTGAGWIG